MKFFHPYAARSTKDCLSLLYISLTTNCDPVISFYDGIFYVQIRQRLVKALCIGVFKLFINPIFAVPPSVVVRIKRVYEEQTKKIPFQLYFFRPTYVPVIRINGPYRKSYFTRY